MNKMADKLQRKQSESRTNNPTTLDSSMSHDETSSFGPRPADSFGNKADPELDSLIIDGYLNFGIVPPDEAINLKKRWNTLLDEYFEDIKRGVTISTTIAGPALHMNVVKAARMTREQLINYLAGDPVNQDDNSDYGEMDADWSQDEEIDDGLPPVGEDDVDTFDIRTPPPETEDEAMHENDLSDAGSTHGGTAEDRPDSADKSCHERR